MEDWQLDKIKATRNKDRKQMSQFPTVWEKIVTRFLGRIIVVCFVYITDLCQKSNYKPIPIRLVG